MICADLDFQIENTKDDLKILRINKDNKWIYIGSKYNMKSEIDKFFMKFNDVKSSESVLIVYGFAVGEHIKLLRRKYRNNDILVFEPNRKLKEYIENLEWVKNDEKLTVACADFECFMAEAKEKIHEFNLYQIQFVYFANYEQIYGKEILDLLKKIKEYFLSVSIEVSTKLRFGERWFETLCGNMPQIVQGVPADLYENRYKNRPAVIVSAGPSLQKNIDLLKDVHDDMIIVSGGRTLRSLIDKGIKPHLLTVVDPLEMSYTLCKDYIEDLNVPLLFYEGTSDKVVNEHKGKKLFFAYNQVLSRIAEHYIQPIISGGSVAHSMASYAAMIGCNPVILIGQDLAYTGERSHALISQNRDGKIGFNELKREDDIYVEDINGNPVRTSLVLNDYRRALEEIIDFYSDTTFINATEGGAKIKGTVQMTLAEAMEKYKKEKFEIFEDIDYKVDMKSNAIKCFEDTTRCCKDIIKYSKEALKIVDEMKKSVVLKKSVNINDLLRKLQNIDKKIEEKRIGIELVDSLIYPIIYEILTEPKDVVKTDKEIVEENEGFYKKIKEMLEFAVECMEKSKERLEEL